MASHTIGLFFSPPHQPHNHMDKNEKKARKNGWMNPYVGNQDGRKCDEMRTLEIQETTHNASRVFKERKAAKKAKQEAKAATLEGLQAANREGLQQRIGAASRLEAAVRGTEARKKARQSKSKSGNRVKALMKGAKTREDIQEQELQELNKKIQELEEIDREEAVAFDDLKQIAGDFKKHKTLESNQVERLIEINLTLAGKEINESNKAKLIEEWCRDFVRAYEKANPGKTYDVIDDKQAFLENGGALYKNSLMPEIGLNGENFAPEFQSVIQHLSNKII